MKRKTLNVLLAFILIALSFCIYIKPSQAYTTDATISNKWFYIKNAYSGRYLDVYMGTAGNGVNVQQCQFNGNDNQQWFLFPQSNGTYVIGSKVGYTTSGGQMYINYVLIIYYVYNIHPFFLKVKFPIPK